MSSSTSDTPPAPSNGLQSEPVTNTAPEASQAQGAKADMPGVGYVSLLQYLGIETPSQSQKEKLERIWDIFSQGKKDRVETLKAIKEARSRLSPPAFGEDYLTKLWAYARLVDDERAIKEEKRVYEK